MLEASLRTRYQRTLVQIEQHFVETVFPNTGTSVLLARHFRNWAKLE